MSTENIYLHCFCSDLTGLGFPITLTLLDSFNLHNQNTFNIHIMNEQNIPECRLALQGTLLSIEGSLKQKKLHIYVYIPLVVDKPLLEDSQYLQQSTQSHAHSIPKLHPNLQTKSKN